MATDNTDFGSYNMPAFESQHPARALGVILKLTKSNQDLSGATADSPARERWVSRAIWINKAPAGTICQLSIVKPTTAGD